MNHVITWLLFSFLVIAASSFRQGGRTFSLVKLTVTFSLTLITILFQANVSTADLISNSGIASYCMAPVEGIKDNAAFTCHLNTDPKNITQRVKPIQENYQTHVMVSPCRIPEVRVGDNVTLTCHCNNDLNQTKQGVKVVQYNSQSFDKTVLACLWHFDEANCIAKYGFKLHGEISNELCLNIPRVTKEHAGTYACVVFDSEPGIQDTCVLTVVDSEREMFPLLLPMLKTVCVLATFIIMLLIAIIVIIVQRKYVSLAIQGFRSENIRY